MNFAQVDILSQNRKNVKIKIDCQTLIPRQASAGFTHIFSYPIHKDEYVVGFCWANLKDVKYQIDNTLYTIDKNSIDFPLQLPKKCDSLILKYDCIQESIPIIYVTNKQDTKAERVIN
jgi:hypothetical protein